MTPAFVLVALGLAVALTILLLTRRRQTPPPALGSRLDLPLPPPPDGSGKAPLVLVSRPPGIVLVHGLLGFDEIRLPGSTIGYFRGVPERLRREGYDVRVALVPSARRVRTRALALASQLSSSEPVVVIAHSMGGLDARYAIARLGLADKVSCLVTIGTPHRGTPLADAVDVAPFRDLTTARMREFNVSVKDAPGVRYASVIARGSAASMHPLLVAPFAYLKLVAGDNDGLVPTASQRWGSVLTEVEADHWAQIGWSRRFDAAPFYAEIARAAIA